MTHGIYNSYYFWLRQNPVTWLINHE